MKLLVSQRLTRKRARREKRDNWGEAGDTQEEDQAGESSYNKEKRRKQIYFGFSN